MTESREGQGEREWKPGKATELSDSLAQRRLTPEEVDKRRGGKRPELRLRREIPTVEIHKTTPAQDILERLGQEDVRSVALRDPETGVTAVVVPVARYLELAGAELANDPFNKEGRLDGRMAPSDAAYAASDVEEVDQEVT